ncbi:MAG: response regulator transcription factor [Tannerella sp.]|jgi:DNA-binding response OmpR family regulator|nr:response regulator transcription factor [Tannerella sp.]
MEKIKLLFVEDDPYFSYIVKGSLELKGTYEVCTALNGKEGLEAYASFVPDIIVADIEMPVMSGLQMVEIIRQKDGDIPIMFATGHTDPQDVVEGYKLNVDNFIKKPYNPDELDGHIQAILRRLKKRKIAENNAKDVFLGEYIFNANAKTLRWRDTKQKLTLREADILYILYENKGEVVKRDIILKKLWGTSDYFSSRSLDVFINKLRKYLSQDSTIEIETFSKKGYRLTLR